MQIFIWLIGGKQINVDMKETDNMAELRDQIYKLTGIKQDQQRIIFKGKDLTSKKDDVTLSSLQIAESTTIQIVHRVSGGIKNIAYH